MNPTDLAAAVRCARALAADLSADPAEATAIAAYLLAPFGEALSVLARAAGQPPSL